MQCIVFCILSGPKSTVPDDLLELIRERMASRRSTQQELAEACGLSQAHLSKVLSSKIKLASKTRRLLSAWLSSDTSAENAGVVVEIAQIVKRLTEGSQERRMQIMQLLRILDVLTR